MSNRHPYTQRDLSSRRAHSRRRSPRRPASIALALACISFASLPGDALAASARPIATSYNVGVNRNALASGTTVKVKVTVTSPEAKVRSWWSQAAVSAVVRKGVNNGRQSPYSSEGYRCTPVVRGETTSFTCKLTGADVPTTVRLTFAVIYRGDQASG